MDLKKRKNKRKEYSTMCQCLVETQKALSSAGPKPKESAQKFSKEPLLTDH